MRCTDKLLSLVNYRNVNEYWDDEAAERNGYEPFEIPSRYELEYLRKRVELMRPVKTLDYNFRKGLDL